MKKIAKLLDNALPLIAITCIAFFLMQAQIVYRSVIIGSDAMFHFNRFYDAAKQLQNFNFSFFQTNYGFQQSGRIINAMYGPFFAYFNGLLLAILGSWSRYQIVTNFMVYLIGGYGMYKLAILVQPKRQIALLVTTIFMNIGWLPRWHLAQNLNSWGAAIAPYVIILGIKMVRQHKIEWFKLGLLMSIIAQIHILSTLILTATLIPFYFYCLKKIQTKQRLILDTLKAVLMTIALSANIWASILYLKFTNTIAAPAPFSLADNALKIGVFKNTRDYIIYSVLIIFIFQLGFVIKQRTQVDKLNFWLTIYGSLVLYLSSSLFFWTPIQKLLPFLASNLQFPVRLTIIAYPLLLAGVAMSAHALLQDSNNIKRHLITGALLFVVMESFVPNVIDAFERSEKYHTYEVLSSWSAVVSVSQNRQEIRHALHDKYPGQLLQLVEKRIPDYLPQIDTKNHAKKANSKLYQEQVIYQYHLFNHKVLPNGKLQLTWKSNNSSRIMIPIITYKQSRLTLNGKVLKHYPKTKIGVPLLHQQKGLNTVTLQFIQPKWMTGLLCFSILMWFILLVFLTQKVLKKFNTP